MVHTILSHFLSSVVPISVIGFVASTTPELSMVVDLACKYKVKPFNDVLYGIPICQSKLKTIQSLKEKLTSSNASGVEGGIHVLVDNTKQVDFLESFIRDNSSSSSSSSSKPLSNEKWSVFLKLDTGYHRAGITCDNRGVQLAMMVIESSFLDLKGVYSHW